MSADTSGRPDEVPVRELTHHTSRLLARVKTGETLTVTERGVPIAVIVPLHTSGRSRPAVGYAASGDPTWAARSAEELAGFGQ